MAGSFSLDHVVLLLPYADIVNPPEWITSRFTVSGGGRHSDNKTENKLVLFRDGTYLELIAFIDDDPENRRGHYWDKPYGVVDYALTSSQTIDYEGLQGRLEDSSTGISYAKPKAGGRTTPDGQELEWEVTFPGGVGRGNVPFFCTDVTPRERRVPFKEANTTHPSGVFGMAGMLLEVQKESLERLSTATSAILDIGKRASNRYEVGVPVEVKEFKEPSIRLQEALADQPRDLVLTFILQSLKHNPRDAVRRKIGDGIVSISFE